MLKNYLKVAFRNLWKHKDSSVINIMGLCIGLCGCILITLFVHDEYQFDQHHSDLDQLHRIYVETFNQDELYKMAITSPRLAPSLVQEFPEVQASLLVYKINQNQLFEFEGQSILESKGFFTQNAIFQFFDLPFLKGDPNTALQEPNTIVLTEALANKYFGVENPIGKDLEINGNKVKVVGVLEKLSPYFHLDFDFLYSFPSLVQMVPEERMLSWIWSDFYNYVKLEPNTDLASLEQKVHQYAEAEIHPSTKEVGFYYYPYFQKVNDIHLYSDSFRNDVAVRSNHVYVKGLIGVGIFLLLIACINFINLSTAKAIKRAKEVGVRKTSGALRSQLALQFIGEAILVVSIAGLLAVILSWILLPQVNGFNGKSISFLNYLTLGNVLWGLAVLFGVGLLSGIYPAFIISGFKPLDAIKSASLRSAGQVDWMRKGLVVLQFGLSILLIISVLIVSQQVSYLAKKELGFQQDQLLHFEMRGNIFENPETAKENFLRIPEVKSVSACFGIPGDIAAGDNVIIPSLDHKTLSTRMFTVDYDYLNTTGMELVAGRAFSREMGSDEASAFIINETAVRTLNLGNSPEEALDKALEWRMWYHSDSLKKGRVVGVVKDFHYNSLHEEVGPVVLHVYPSAFWKIAMRIESEDASATIAAIEKTWDSFETGYPFTYQFVDEGFAKMYEKERSWNQLLWIASGLAIFIAIIGAIGLAVYATEQRRKEIGIRKVLGASVFSIVSLLSKDFLLLILIALVVFSPLSWYFMSQWLENFAYRVPIYWWIFPLAGVCTLLVALLSVGSQSMVAAMKNPITSLRSE